MQKEGSLYQEEASCPPEQITAHGVYLKQASLERVLHDEDADVTSLRGGRMAPMSMASLNTVCHITLVTPILGIVSGMCLR